MSSYYLPSESKIGAGYQAHGLAQALVDAGHNVTMFSPCSKPDGARYHHVAVKVAKPFATFRWAAALRRQDLTQFDVFHAAGDDYWFWGKHRGAHVRTMYGSCLAEALRIRGLKERLRMVLLGLGEVLATFAADETVLISSATRRWLPWVNTIIPSGVDPAVFHPGGPKEDEPTILFVGTYANRKRGKLLMELFEREILPAIPAAKLWMVTTDAPGAPGVEVLGRLSDDELADRYRRAWVFCLPSTYEGFGVPYAEALASGLPVVATPNAGAKEVLGNGDYGRIAPDEQLGRAIIELLMDGDARDALSARGVTRAQEFFWPAIVAQYESIYKSLLRDPPRRRTWPQAQGATAGSRA